MAFPVEIMENMVEYCALNDRGYVKLASQVSTYELQKVFFRLMSNPLILIVIQCLSMSVKYL